MGKLTNEQRNKLRDFLQGQGLTFKPLLEEMVDHVICDLEDRMLQGSSFHEAWDQSMKEIPKDHLQIIQKQTMETINKRFTLSQGLSYIDNARRTRDSSNVLLSNRPKLFFFIPRNTC